MIGIIDYGMGNILSVYNAIKILGEPVKICQQPEDILTTDKLILPGVGAIQKCMLYLQERHLITALNEAVIKQGKPILGICLGMQVMANISLEGGNHNGLGWFDATVLRLTPNLDAKLRIPHIGWNQVYFQKNSPLFKDITHTPDFYFVHSYHMQCANQEDIHATCGYGKHFVAAICKNNIAAVQFHPEKSQDLGLKVLENFITWNV